MAITQNSCVSLFLDPAELEADTLPDGKFVEFAVHNLGCNPNAAVQLYDAHRKGSLVRELGRADANHGVGQDMALITELHRLELA
jgi:hypothetical protein